MRYLDANIFIYAYFKPKPEKILSDKIKWCKDEAKHILRIINKQEEKFCISLIQLSEVANLLKSVMNWIELQNFLSGLISNDSIDVAEVTKSNYFNAISKVSKYNMDSNDISAFLIMKEKNIKEIYTFDRHFQNLPGITCLPEIPKEFI